MSDFQLQRLGMLMEPEPGNPQEVEGVLNPAAVRGPDGQLYLFPWLVAKGNYSRIGIDRRDDLGAPDRFDVYYGMADNRIGVARLDLPNALPSGGVTNPPEAKV
jgi:hypothetical protein